MFSQFSYSKQKPSLNHSDQSEQPTSNEHLISDSDSSQSPVKPKMSEKNGVNGVPKVYTISDSDSEDAENSNVQVVRNSDEERNITSPKNEEVKSPVKTYSRIKQMNDDTPAKKATVAPSSSVSKLANSNQTVRSPFKRKAVTMKHSKVKKKKRKNSESSDEGNEFKSASTVVDSDMDSDEEVSNQMNLSQKKVFDFLNDASTIELLLVPSSTEKKANTLVSLRPFKNWRQAVDQFKNTRSLGLSFLNSVSNFLKTRSTVSNLMKKCLNIAVDTEAVVADGKTRLKEQPSSLTSSMRLKNYQMVGLNWLVVMHSQNLNVILADEMGLGKTIQVISFLAYLNETNQTKSTKSHLIVAPSSTIENWSFEFAKWCPNLNVVIYHGSPDERRMLRVQWFREKFVGIDVIITTYNMISTSCEEKKMFKILPIQYVIFDEAHMLKNMNTQRYVNLFNINAERRILLTGTPLQNNLLELMSLLNFVMPDMFHSKIDYIKDYFAKKTKVPAENLPEFEQEQIELAKRIMKPFILRRLKNDVLQDLPTKTSEVIKCPLTEDQKVKYDIYKSEAAELAKIGGPDYNYMSTFMALRKLANHPLTLRYIYGETELKAISGLLAEDIFYKDTYKQYIFDDLIFMSDHDIHKLALEHTSIAQYKLSDDKFLAGGKFAKLDEILPKLKEEGHRVIIFSQFLFVLDLLEEYLRIRDLKYLRLDGSVKSLERQDLIDNYNEDASIFVFLCTTKAGGIGINLTTADTVIIHDVDFNPYNDKQAEDRCHRIGQTKPVHIMRFISEGTVEEAIYKMAQDKLNLEQELTSKDTEDENEESKNVELLLKEALGMK